MEDLELNNISNRLRDMALDAQQARKDRAKKRFYECVKLLVERNRDRMEEAAKNGAVWVEVSDDGSDEFKFLSNTEIADKVSGFEVRRWQSLDGYTLYLCWG